MRRYYRSRCQRKSTKNLGFYTFFEIIGLKIPSISNSRCKEPNISKFLIRNTYHFDRNPNILIEILGISIEILGLPFEIQVFRKYVTIVVHRSIALERKSSCEIVIFLKKYAVKKIALLKRQLLQKVASFEKSSRSKQEAVQKREVMWNIAFLKSQLFPKSSSSEKVDVVQPASKEWHSVDIFILKNPPPKRYLFRKVTALKSLVFSRSGCSVEVLL